MKPHVYKGVFTGDWIAWIGNGHIKRFRTWREAYSYAYEKAYYGRPDT